MTHVDHAAAQTERNPTEAQKRAGNYRKGSVKVHGLDISIENARGSFRSGVDGDGKPWKVRMPAHYGYIRGTNGADDDHVDAYIGPHIKSPKVYIVNQNDADSGDFDEHKVFLGFASKRQVIRAYMDAFSDGKGGQRLGRISEMDVPQFREWLKSDTSKPHKYAAGGGVRGYADAGAVDEWAGLDLQPPKDEWAGLTLQPPKTAPASTGDHLRRMAGAVADQWTQPKDGAIDERNQFASAITDVPHEIYEAGKSALSNINDKLNPFSDAGHQRTLESLKATSVGDRLKETAKQFGDVGSGLMSIPALASAPVTGTARSLIGHPYSAITGMPYDQAKEAVDTAMMAVAPRGASPVGRRAAPAPRAEPPTADEIRDASRQAYHDVRALGVEINPVPVSQLARRIETDLTDLGLTHRNVPETYEIIRTLQNPPRGSVMRAQDFENARQELVQARQNPTNRREAVAANAAINHLDNYLATIPANHVIRGDVQRFRELIGDARGNWAAASRADAVGGKLELGDLNAATANSGRNIDNATRQAVKQLIRPDKNGRSVAEKTGFSQEEIAQMNRVARGTFTGNALRYLSHLFGGGGGMGAYLTGAGAHMASGSPLGWAAPLVGAVLKSASNASTARQAAALDALVRSRSPLHRANIPPPQLLPPPRPLAGFVPMSNMGVPMINSPRGLGAVPASADDNRP